MACPCGMPLTGLRFLQGVRTPLLSRRLPGRRVYLFDSRDGMLAGVLHGQLILSYGSHRPGRADPLSCRGRGRGDASVFSCLDRMGWRAWRAASEDGMAGEGGGPGGPPGGSPKAGKSLRPSFHGGTAESFHRRIGKAAERREQGLPARDGCCPSRAIGAEGRLSSIPSSRRRLD